MEIFDELEDIAFGQYVKAKSGFIKEYDIRFVAYGQDKVTGGVVIWGVCYTLPRLCKLAAAFSQAQTGRRDGGRNRWDLSAGP